MNSTSEIVSSIITDDDDFIVIIQDGLVVKTLITQPINDVLSKGGLSCEKSKIFNS